MNKIIDKIKATIRWRIAYFLDRFPDVCWADAASWANFPEHYAFSEVLDLRNTAGQCKAMGETAYCGKCAVLGSNPHPHRRAVKLSGGILKGRS